MGMERQFRMLMYAEEELAAITCPNKRHGWVPKMSCKKCVYTAWAKDCWHDFLNERFRNNGDFNRGRR